ncbi:MAG: hypothetical protein AAFY56_15385, partial [Pseudomonadota bacterium]
MRRFLKVIGILVLIPIVLVAIIVAALQVQPVRDRLMVVVEDAVSGPDFGLTIEGFRGSPPFDMRFDRIALSDSEGVWLDIRDIHLAIAWRKFFALRAEIDEIYASSISVARAPVATEPAEEEPPGEFALPPPPELPESLPPVALNRLAVDDIAIGEPLFGQAISLGLQGHAKVSEAKDQADIALDVRRLDQATAEASLEFVLDLVTQALAIDLHAEETGGLLAAITQMPDAGNLRVDLNGEGPLADWQGELDADAQNLAQLSTTLALAYTDRLGIGLDAKLTAAASLLPAGIEPLTGTDFALQLAADFADPGLVTLHSFALTSDGPTIQASGHVDLDQQAHDLVLTAELTELSKASAIAAADMDGSAKLVAKSHGPVAQPQLSVELVGSELAFDAFALDRLSLALDAEITKPIDGAVQAATAKLDGSVNDLTQNGKPLLVDDRLTLSVLA